MAQNESLMALSRRRRFFSDSRKNLLIPNGFIDGHGSGGNGFMTSFENIMIFLWIFHSFFILFVAKDGTLIPTERGRCC